MDSYRKNPLTQQELDKWIKNKIYNPRTNRKIKPSGKIYKYLKKVMIHNKYKNESYNNFHGKKIVVAFFQISTQTFIIGVAVPNFSVF